MSAYGMLADRAGRRALAISLAGLLVTAAVQAVIFMTRQRGLTENRPAVSVAIT